MIQNRLIVPEGNTLSFVLNHKENGEKYTLSDNCNYYIIVSQSEEPFGKQIFCKSNSENFSVSNNLSAGEYVFEIGIIDKNNNRRVILPALDERLNPLNQLLILRRLPND